MRRLLLIPAVRERGVDDEHDSVDDGQPRLGHTGGDIRRFQREPVVIVVRHHSRSDIQSSADQHVEHVLKYRGFLYIKR